MRSLSNVGPGIDKPALFNGTVGNAATVSVRSAYFDLFRHILYEIKQEHSIVTPQANAKTAAFTSLEAFIPLLEILTTTMTPLLYHITPSSSSAERLATSLTQGKSGSSPPRPAPAARNPANSDYQGRPGRTGRSSSCPSVVRTDARELTTPIVSDQESISVVCAAIPVLGVVLSGQGDVLNPNGRGPGSICKKTTVHHAAWRALGVVSMQLCSSASAWATNANGGGGGCFEPSQQAAGAPPGSSSKDLDRHNASREWWGAMQSTLRVVCDELVRARDCLEKLRQRSRAEGIALAATGAVRLFVGPVPFPLPVTWTCPTLPGADRSEINAVCFWVWGPTRVTVHDPGPRNDMRRGCRSSGIRRDTLEYHSRRTVFTRLHKRSSIDKTACGEEWYVGVSLTRSLPCEERGKPGGTNNDVGGYYVEIALGRTSRSQLTAEGTRTQGQGHEFDDRRENVATVPASNATTADEQGEEYQSAGDNGYGHGQESETETFLSEYPLPQGRWTHVCCTYLGTQGGSRSGGKGVLPYSTGGGVTIAFNGNIVAHRSCSSCVVGRTAETMTPTLGRAPKHSEPQLGDQHLREMSTKISNNLYASEYWEDTPVVCDVDWHPRNVSPEQAHQMADNGVPTQREDAQRAAESYVSRLVGLAEKISASSQRVAATLSSPRWLSLWLKLMSVTGNRSKRAIVRLLRPLLCTPSQPIGEGCESVRETSKVQPGSPPDPLSTGSDFSDRAVVHRLCGLLGGCMIPSLLCHKSHRVPNARDDDSSTPTSSRIQQDPSIPSEIVLLLRSLVEEAPTRWREHVFVALTDGLSTAARGEFSSLVKSTEIEKGTDWDEDHQTWLGAAAAAAYLGGGQIEGAHLGARVVLLPRPRYTPAGTPPNAKERSGGVKRLGGNGEGLLREMLGNTCMSSDTTLVGEDAVNSMCRGTVVGWVQNDNETPTMQEGMIFVAVDEQYQDCLDESSDGNPALQGKSRKTSDDRGLTVEPRCRVVAVPAQHVIFQAETTEPATPFLFLQALSSVLVFLDPPPTSSARVSSLSNDETESGGGVSKEIGVQLVAAHVRCRLLRALAVQLRNVEQAGAAVRAGVLRPLLALGASPLASALVLALGADGAVAFSQRRDFAAIVLSLRSQREASDNSLLSELESVCQMVWSRLTIESGDREGLRPECTPRPAEHVKGNGVEQCGSNCSRPTLQVLGGEALVEGNRVTACSHFPTICLSHVAVGLGSIGGRWYYEVTLLTGGLMQLGWAGPLFQCSPTRGQGVGDHMHSWAFDGFRQKRWCVSSASYGKRWRAGDVVGILLDAGLQEMRFR